MAPITSDVVDELRNQVKRLEMRVQELEGSIQHGGGPSHGSNPLQSMRMVIMGPPGAGEHLQTHFAEAFIVSHIL